MSHFTAITPERIRTNLKERITEYESELLALKAVKIDLKQKTLTNRAVTGEGARIGEYLGINKALYVSYAVKFDDGSTRYCSRDITAYSYNNPDGSEIGTEGMMRISRTITPAELSDILHDVIASLANNIGELKSEYRRADGIARKHNALVDQITKFNNGLSYAGKAQI